MNCEKFREYLDNYENLTTKEKAEMTFHTSQCEKCAAELDFMLSIIETTKSLPKINPPSDFMDKLNVRIDAEEKKKQKITRRILKNVQRNWRQYASAAACLVLVAVITANGKSLIGNMDGGDNSDNGVIIEETVTTDKDTENVQDNQTALPINSNVPENDTAGNGAVPVLEEKFTPSNYTTALNNTGKTPMYRAAIGGGAVNGDRTSSVKTAGSSLNPNVTASATPENTTDIQNENKSSDTSNKEQNENISDLQGAQTTEKPDYGIAVARITPEVDISAYSEEADRYSRGNARNAYSLADDGDNIALGKYYNDDDYDKEDGPTAIGKLKISSVDAQKAMSVIEQYSYDYDGNLYTTDSTNLTLILSNLNREAVNYTNYTIENNGVIKFKVVFD